MDLIKGISKFFSKNKFQASTKEVEIIKKGFLQLHDSYERIKQDLNNAQQCTYYILNVSKSNTPDEIVFFYNEIGTRYAGDFNNLGKAIKYYQTALDFVKKTSYDKKIDDLVYFNSMIGKSYYFKGDFQKSLDFYFKSKNIIEETGKGEDSLTTIMSSIEANKVKLDELN